MGDIHHQMAVLHSGGRMEGPQGGDSIILYIYIYKWMRAHLINICIELMLLPPRVQSCHLVVNIPHQEEKMVDFLPFFKMLPFLFFCRFFTIIFKTYFDFFVSDFLILQDEIILWTVGRVFFGLNFGAINNNVQEDSY